MLWNVFGHLQIQSLNVAYPIAAGHNLVYSSIHSSEVHFALGLFLDSCGCSCPLRLQAIDNREEDWEKLNKEE